MSEKPFSVDVDRLSETFNNSVLCSGIETKDNGLICYGQDRAKFILSASRRIAEMALRQEVYRHPFDRLGMKNLDFEGFDRVLKASPSNHELRSMNARRTFKDGKKDFMTIRGEQLCYGWLQNPIIAGDGGNPINILVAEMNDKATEEIIELAQAEPTNVHTALIQALYPNALIPLSEQEIVEAIRREGPALIDLYRRKRVPENQIQIYEDRLADPETQVQYIQARSYLSRKDKCEELELAIS